MEIREGHNHIGINNAEGIKTNKLSPLGYFIRLIAKWLGFTGLYAAFAVCPCCGQPGCPVGIGSAGIIGAFAVLIFNDWKILFSYIKSKMKK